MIRISESQNSVVRSSLDAGLAPHRADEETEAPHSTHDHITLPGKDVTMSLRKPVKL